MKKQLTVGTALGIITPPMGYPMAGFAARTEGAVGVHDDLRVKALALDDGANPLLFVSLDLLEITLETCTSLRERIASVTGIKPGGILFAATHTHGGPELRGVTAFVVEETPLVVDEDWIPRFKDIVVATAIKAWENRRAARIGIGTASVTGIGVNRRGKNITDDTVGIIKVEAVDRKPMAVLVNYTCHAVVLGPDNRLWTGDYPGYTERFIENALSREGIALFMNGAAGDINTGHSADTSAIGGHIPGRTFTRAKELGEKLGQTVLEALPGIDTAPHVTLGHRVSKWEPRYRRDLPTPAECRQLIKELELRIAQDKGRGLDTAKAQLDLVYRKILLQNSLDMAKAARGVKVTEIQAVQMGEAALVTLPGEAFVELGLRIKELSPYAQTMVIGYANDAIGYIPTKEALLEGGYEGTSAKFHQDTGEELIEAAVAALIDLQHTFA